MGLTRRTIKHRKDGHNWLEKGLTCEYVSQGIKSRTLDRNDYPIELYDNKQSKTHGRHCIGSVLVCICCAAGCRVHTCFS